MNSVRPAVWRRAEALFDRVLQQPTGQRDRFLSRSCGDDRELRQAVESLLDVDRWGTALPVVADEEAHERWLGPYRLLRSIGQGGMGHVWLGERIAEDLRQQVAIKHIERSDHPLLERLFRRERQILARLEHPNIARFLDSGIAEGFPYVVMEYVPGAPFIEYCNARRLGIRPRLELFVKVCRAVQHAHQSLIVHRDLKPRNILVTDDGEPKLLDFGIAKLLDPTTGSEEATVTLGRFLTPAYASPEQLAGQPVSTASDIYSLGMILYELLTGCLPSDLRGASPAAVLDLRREEPTLPSEATKQAGGEAPSEARAACRNTTPARLRRQLKGDLDRIVLLALRPDPRERYGSAEQLAEDLRRYLAGLAVLAQPQCLAYRARKFMRRHVAAVAAASVLMVALAAFAAQSALYSRRLTRERDFALQAQRESEQVTQLLIDAFRLADPYQRADVDSGAGAQLTAREVLDRSAERVAGQLVQQPLVQARLLDALGEVYTNLGAQDRALALLHRGLTIRRRTLDRSHPERLESLRNLGLLLIDRGRLDEAEPLLRQALAGSRGDEQTAQSLAAWGRLLLSRGDYAGAERTLSEALERRRRGGSGHSRAEAEILIHRGAAKWHLGQMEASEPDLQQGLTLLRRVAGEEHPSTARALHYLGLLRIQQGDLARAEPLFRRALALRRKLQGDEHPETIESLEALGRFLVHSNDFERAKPILREALALDRKVLGTRHPSVATALTSLGVVLTQQADLAGAEPLFREAASIAQERWGAEHPKTLDCLRNLGKLLSEKGDFEAAEPILRAVVEVQLQRCTSQDCDAAWAVEALADLLIRTKRPAQARPLAERAVRDIAATYGKGHWRTAMAEGVLGDCLTRLGHFPEAERFLLAGLPKIAGRYGESSKHTRAARQRLAQLYRAWGRSARPGRAPSLRPAACTVPLNRSTDLRP